MSRHLSVAPSLSPTSSDVFVEHRFRAFASPDVDARRPRARVNGRLRSAIVGVLFALAACADDAAQTPERPDAGGLDVDIEIGEQDGSGAQSDPWQRCASEDVTVAYPTSIQAVVEHINGLPHPVTLPCFLHSLDAPLGLNATDSPFSAQPAEGAENPRIFLMHPELIMSVTLGVRGRQLLEFGELQDDGLTLKGELEFPIETTLGPGAPFERITFNGRHSGCATCHALEREAGEVGGVMSYASQPLRTADHALLNLDEVAALESTCDRSADPGRCDLLEALFADGEWEEVAFPAHFLTAFR